MELTPSPSECKGCRDKGSGGKERWDKRQGGAACKLRVDPGGSGSGRLSMLADLFELTFPRL